MQKNNISICSLVPALKHVLLHTSLYKNNSIRIDKGNIFFCIPKLMKVIFILETGIYSLYKIMSVIISYMYISYLSSINPLVFLPMPQSLCTLFSLQVVGTSIFCLFLNSIPHMKENIKHLSRSCLFYLPWWFPVTLFPYKWQSLVFFLSKWNFIL